MPDAGSCLLAVTHFPCVSRSLPMVRDGGNVRRDLLRVGNPDFGGRPAYLSDMKVGDFAVGGFTRPLVLAVGDIGMTVADPFLASTTRVRPRYVNEAAGDNAEITWAAPSHWVS